MRAFGNTKIQYADQKSYSCGQCKADVGAGLSGHYHEANCKHSRCSCLQCAKLFCNKEGLIAELVKLMFSGQFSAAKQSAETSLPPTFTYAAETAIQIVLMERNENLRELYTEAYTMPDTVKYIYQNMARELKAIFGDRFPDYEESEFYEMEIGSAALMCGYMAKPCDVHFPLHRKIERFLTASLSIYRVGEDEIEQILAFVRGLDINKLADGVMQQLFEQLGELL